MVVQYSGLVSFIELNVLFQYGAFLFSAIYYFFYLLTMNLNPKITSRPVFLGITALGNVFDQFLNHCYQYC